MSGLQRFWFSLFQRPAFAISGGVIAFLLLLILFLPTLLSTSWGKDRILGQINSSIPGKVEVQSISLGWFTNQTVTGIVVRDPEGRPVVTVGKATADTSPLALLFAKFEMGNAQMVGFHADIVQDSQGYTNLHTAFGSTENATTGTSEQQVNTSPSFYVRIPFKGNLAIQDGTISLRGNDLEPVSLDDIQATLEYNSSNGTSTIQARGQSHQEDLSGLMSIQANLSGLDKEGRLYFVQNAAGLPLPQGAGQVHLKVDIDNTAVDVLDQLITFKNPSWTGILTQALGPTLNLKLDLLLSATGPAVEVESKSANLEADLVTRFREGSFVLERPGTISFRMTPQLFQRLWGLQNVDSDRRFVLKQDAMLHIDVDRLTLPTRLAQERGVQPTVRVGLRLSDAYWISSDALGNFSIRSVTGSIERLEASGALVYQVNGVMMHAEQKGTLRIAGKVLDKQGFAGYLPGDVVLSAEKFPIAILDSLFDTDGTLRDTFGVNLDVLAKFSSQPNMDKLDLKLGSDVMAAPSLEFTVGDAWRLLKPAQMHFQVTPSLIRYLTGSESLLHLEESTNILVNLKELTIPLRQGSSFHLNADAATAPFVLGGIANSKGRARFSNFKLLANGGATSDIQFSLRTEISPDGVAPFLTAALGSASTLEIAGHLSSTPQPKVAFKDVRISLQNELMDARAQLHSLADGSIGLVSPASLRYNMKPELLIALGLLNPEIPHLSQRTPLEIKVNEFTWRLRKGTSPEILLTSGKALISELLVVQGENVPKASLKDVNFSWHLDQPSQNASAILRSTTTNNNVPGTLDIVAEAKNWKNGWQTLKATLDVAAQNFPVSFVSSISGQQAWSSLIGDSINSNLKAFYGSDEPSSFAIKGEEFQASASFKLGTKSAFLESDKPLALSWTVTPERWTSLEKLVGALPWEVSQPNPVNLTLTSYSLPWAEKRFVEYPQLAGSLNLNGLQVQDTSTEQDLAFELLTLAFQTPNVAKSVTFKLDTKEFAEKGQSPSQMTVKGELTGLHGKSGWMNPQTLGVDIAMAGQRLSLVNLLRYPLQRASVSVHLPGLIGARVTGTAELQLHGPDGHIKANLLGDSGRFDLDGQINQRVLTLNRSLALELQVTPQLRQGLLREVAPYMVSARSTDKPIRFTVDPLGFALPLDTGLRGVRIAKATLDLGKVDIDNNSQLGVVMGILSNKREKADGTFKVWFTPLHLSLNDGVLKFSRMDALIAERFPVAMWGKIDVPKDRVRMTIGITATALREAYALANVNDNYMLQLPLTGSIDNATVDKGRATARITALVAQSHGTTEGDVIGGVLDLLGGSLQDDKVPPPSDPIPWATQSSQQPIAEEKPKIDVPKELKKGAKKLLDALKG